MSAIQLGLLSAFLDITLGFVCLNDFELSVLSSHSSTVDTELFPIYLFRILLEFASLGATFILLRLLLERLVISLLVEFFGRSLRLRILRLLHFVEGSLLSTLSHIK